MIGNVGIKKRFVVIAVLLIVFGCIVVIEGTKLRKNKEILQEAKDFSLIREILGTDTEVDYADKSAYIPVGDRVVLYKEIKFVKSEKLHNYKGEFFLEGKDCNWYYVKSRKGVQYLIAEYENGENSLWEYDQIVCIPTKEVKENYPEASYEQFTYKEVLELIYHVNETEDISYIVAYYQPREWVWEAIEIRDASTIEKICNTLCRLEHGVAGVTTREWLPYRTEEIKREVKENGEKNYDKKIIIVLSDGTTIENMGYDSAVGAFYENSMLGYFAGTVYEVSDDADYEEMNIIFEME